MKNNKIKETELTENDNILPFTPKADLPLLQTASSGSDDDWLSKVPEGNVILVQSPQERAAGAIFAKEFTVINKKEGFVNLLVINGEEEVYVWCNSKLFSKAFVKLLEIAKV